MAQERSLLVGPAGWYFEDHPTFLRNLGDPNPDFDAILFAVRNLGFVKLSRHDVLLEITMHPRNVDERTLQTVQQFLLSSNATLFRIKHLEADWVVETLASARAAMIRIFDLFGRQPTVTAGRRAQDLLRFDDGHRESLERARSG